ncbi:MAG: DUF6448 family protein [Acidobacteriota bacterium]
MRTGRFVKTTVFSALAAAIILAAGGRALAHCDTMDGPVVKAARKALETSNVNAVLIWVQKKDEAEVIRAFQKTIAVRKLNAEARELADMYFFETVVRIHRAGEGEPYTGLKPAGQDIGPAIPAADQSIEAGTVDRVERLLSETVQKQLREKFKHAMERKNFDKDDTHAGREFVKAYVEFIHYVETVYDSASKPAQEHPHT